MEPDPKHPFWRRIKGVVPSCLVLTITLSGCGSNEPSLPEEPAPEEEKAPEPVEEATADNARPEAHATFDAYLVKLLDDFEAEWGAKTGKPVVTKKKDEAPTTKEPAAAPKPKTYKELIVGKWKMSQGGQTVTMKFKADGNIEFSSDAMASADFSMEASYEWDSDDTFTMTMKTSGPNGQSHEQSVTVTVKSIDDTSMTLVYKHGEHEQEQSFTRVSG